MKRICYSVCCGMLLGLVVSVASPGMAQGQAGSAFQQGALIYENTLADSEALAGWVMEGPGVLEFTNRWMEMYSPGKKWDHVLWCPEQFPANFIAEWEVRNTRPQGLAIVFFAATGDRGQSIFDPDMPPRDGTFREYNRGRIHCYHISYYADNPKHPDRGDSHLRKDPGQILLKTGKEGIPVGSVKSYRVRLVKHGGRILMFVDGRKILDGADDGTAHGPVYGAGRIGFRQMRWSRLGYRDFKVWRLVEPEEVH